MANITDTSIAGPDAFLGNIRNFINNTLTGWTLHVDLVVPPTGEDTAGGRELIASKGDVLFGIRSTTLGSSDGNLFLFDGNGVYSGADNIDEMTGNSGIRVTDAQYDDLTPTARLWNEVGAGTWPNIWIFGDDSPSYFHMVAEISTGVFRHMWVGELSPKIGSWTGGAYYGAEFWSLSTPIDQPDSISHIMPFDAYAEVTNARSTTLHCETLTPTSSWVQPNIQTSNPVLNSVQRAAGISFGPRGGLGTNDWFNSGVSPLSGTSFFTPVGCFYIDKSDNPNTFHHLGFVPDVKLVNIESIDPASTITIGSDTYRIFPMAARNGAAMSNNSGLYGIAYREF